MYLCLLKTFGNNNVTKMWHNRDINKYNRQPTFVPSRIPFHLEWNSVRNPFHLEWNSIRNGMVRLGNNKLHFTRTWHFAGIYRVGSKYAWFALENLVFSYTKFYAAWNGTTWLQCMQFCQDLPDGSMVCVICLRNLVFWMLLVKNSWNYQFGMESCVYVWPGLASIFIPPMFTPIPNTHPSSIQQHWNETLGVRYQQLM